MRLGWIATKTGIGVPFAIHAIGEENGTIVGSTGTTIGGTSTLNFNRVHFKTDLLAIIEGRVKLSDASECDAYFGFKKDADEYAYFHLNNGDIWAECDDAGVEGTYATFTGATASDDTYVVLTVELLSTETAKYYVDGVLKKTSTTGAVTVDPMDVYAHVVNTSVTDIDYTIDYIRIWQKRT